MTEPFEDRLREAAVEPQGINFSALRSASAKASTQLTRDRALAIVRMAHRQPVPQSVISDFVARMNADEALVEEYGQDQLVSLLAVESLVSLLSRNVQSIGVLTASAIRCGEHAGWLPAHPDLLDIARLFLEQRSVSIRERHPINGSLAKDKPKFEVGTAQHGEEELQALRDVVKGDRARFWERDQLVWWLLSETRPTTVFAVAQSFNFAVSFIPEPITTDELLRAKLGKMPGSPSLPRLDSVPSEMAEFCPYLGALIRGEREDPVIPTDLPTEDAAKWVREIRNYLDELLLIRAFQIAS